MLCEVENGARCQFIEMKYEIKTKATSLINATRVKLLFETVHYYSLTKTTAVNVESLESSNVKDASGVLSTGGWCQRDTSRCSQSCL